MDDFKQIEEDTIHMMSFPMVFSVAYRDNPDICWCVFCKAPNPTIYHVCNKLELEDNIEV